MINKCLIGRYLLSKSKSNSNDVFIVNISGFNINNIRIIFCIFFISLTMAIVVSTTNRVNLVNDEREHNFNND